MFFGFLDILSVFDDHLRLTWYLQVWAASGWERKIYDPKWWQLSSSWRIFPPTASLPFPPPFAPWAMMPAVGLTCVSLPHHPTSWKECNFQWLLYSGYLLRNKQEQLLALASQNVHLLYHKKLVTWLRCFRFVCGYYFVSYHRLT